jgi:hypothetical protein
MLLDEDPPCLAHSIPALGILQQFNDSVSYGGNLARRNKHSSNAITHHLAYAAHICGDYRPSASRSLDQGYW